MIFVNLKNETSLSFKFKPGDKVIAYGSYDAVVLDLHSTVAVKGHLYLIEYMNGGVTHRVFGKDLELDRPVTGSNVKVKVGSQTLHYSYVDDLDDLMVEPEIDSETHCPKCSTKWKATTSLFKDTPWHDCPKCGKTKEEIMKEFPND